MMSKECPFCKHFINTEEKDVCLAYPLGIPSEILVEGVSHDKVLKNQLGKWVFEIAPIWE